MSAEDAALPLGGQQRAADGPLAAEYRRLMRWYPKRWRAENENAMLGTFLDQAEQEGRDYVNDDDRSALWRAAMGQWFGFPTHGRRLRLIPLALGAALSIFYAAFVIWAPRTAYPGSIGPFANPSVITCVLLVVALILGLFVRSRIADVLALARSPRPSSG